MVLYKATKDGNIRLTDEEEAEIKAQWEQFGRDQESPRPRVPTLEERVSALEAIIKDKK